MNKTLKIFFLLLMAMGTRVQIAAEYNYNPSSKAFEGMVDSGIRSSTEYAIASKIVQGLYDTPATIGKAIKSTINFLKIPVAWDYVKSTVTGVTSEAVEAILTIFGYPLIIAKAVADEYLRRGGSKQNAEGIEIIGQFATAASAILGFIGGVFALVPDKGVTVLTGKSRLIALAPLIAGASLYLSSAGLRAYTSLMDAFANTMDKADAGTLTDKDIKETEETMKANIEILKKEAQKSDHGKRKMSRMTTAKA